MLGRRRMRVGRMSKKLTKKARERAAAFAYQAGAAARANEASLLMTMDDRSDIAGFYGYADWAEMPADLTKEARAKFKEGWFAEKRLEESGWNIGKGE